MSILVHVLGRMPEIGKLRNTLTVDVERSWVLVLIDDVDELVFIDESRSPFWERSVDKGCQVQGGLAVQCQLVVEQMVCSFFRDSVLMRTGWNGSGMDQSASIRL